ncbi:MAG TPA: outer membrane protein transport protein [Planctomycetota bacterium]|nr:outer membrane protein transport protein [Planctomycetota bacterium]
MRRTLMGLGVLFLAVPFASAQTTRPRARTIPIQFQFAPPGARALAMGATFVAIADDATAAESNPAGLTILTKPEISAHFRTSRFEPEFVNPFDIEETATFATKVYSPAYFSLVYPFKNAAISVYYQQATNFESSAAFSDQFELFLGTPANFVLNSQAELLLDNIGASLAYKVTPKLSIGASVRASRLKFKNAGDTFDYADVDGDTYRLQEQINDDNRKVTFNVGILANPNGNISAGVFYKKGGKFDLTRVTQEFSSGPNFGNDLASGPTPEDVRYEIPDAFSGGIAVRPTDRWVVSGEVTWIKYSVLSPSQDDLTENSDTLEAIDDGVEVHFGTEYTFLSGRTPFSIRAGIFTDPDHDGQKLLDSKQVHGTFGAGFVLGGRFQVDFGANFAKRVKEGLVSFVYRF